MTTKNRGTRRGAARDRMSDAAVRAKTGKNWNQWFAILDKAGARKLTHQQIVAILSKKHNVGSWWQQMVTVGYEKARGRRKLHQRPDGYSISRSKTINAPVSHLYKAWHDRQRRSRWLRDNRFNVRKATANKSLRITWVDGKTTVETMFYPKGAAKCQVTVQHNKLPDAKSGERMKDFWGRHLERLKEILES